MLRGLLPCSSHPGGYSEYPPGCFCWCLMIEFDPSWEYFTPDPEIAELFAEQQVEGLEAICDWRLTKVDSLGLRFGKGNPDSGNPFHLKKAKYVVERKTIQVRDCVLCGEPFLPNRDSRTYCGIKCSLKALVERNRREPVVLVCAWNGCRREFIQNSHEQRFCTLFCANEAQRLEVIRKEGQCPCGKELEPSKSHNKKSVKLYCSRACKQKFTARASRARKRDHEGEKTRHSQGTAG
jgi:hypothetical protein